MVSYDKTGPEIVISDQTSSYYPQWDWRQQSAAKLTSDTIVTVWQGNGPNGNVVIGQFVDTSGALIGSEFVIGERGMYGSTSVLPLANGRFMVAWGQDPALGDPSSSGVVLQVMAADGTTVGSPILVNTTTEGPQGWPAMASLSDGGFVVTWTTFGASISFQRYDASGSRVGSETIATNPASGYGYESTVTGLANGAFAIAWTDNSQENGDTSGAGISVRIFNADGNPIGNPFSANTTTESSQFIPQMTTLANGNFIVTWVDYSQTGEDTSAGAIRAQIIDASGTKVGNEILVNTTTASLQYVPTTTALANGDFVILWSDVSEQGDDTSAWSVRGQTFSASGEKTGSEFVANTTTNANQLAVTVTAGPGNSFFAFWFDDNSSGFRGQWFDAPLPVISGTTGNDRLNGTAAAERIEGLAGDDRLNGGAGDDVLNGGEGNDTLTGGTGADKMTGGTGNDTFYVDNAGDTVVEAQGEGTDIVYSTVNFTLTDNIENLTLTGNTAIDGTGNALDNRINGNSGANVLSGGDGKDTLSGDAGDDTLNGENGNDTLNGGTGNDTLNGDAGADTLSGGVGDDTLNGGDGNDTLRGDAGADAMTGGLGDDSYYVDDAGDTVVEAQGEGTDTAYSTVSFTLADNVENLTLTGAAAIDGTGNAMANRLVGNAAANVFHGGDGADTIRGEDGNDALWGEDGNDTLNGGNGNDGVFGGWGNDTLNGGAGDDVLHGSEGNDTLNGDAGADRMMGSTGNDTYYVDNVDDIVSEEDDMGADEGGTELVNSSITFTLGAYLENLTLTGSAAINGTGNALANTLTGNAGANTLAGGDGNDVLSGGAGNDILHGEIGNDTLSGGAGSDVIIGGVGIDTLSGGAGSDLFRFAETGAANKDRITDFASGTDKIVLDAEAFGLTEGNGLTNGSFDTDWFAARSANASHGQFLWNATSKTLSWDVDGTGATAAVAIVTLNSSMTVNDIQIG